MFLNVLVFNILLFVAPSPAIPGVKKGLEPNSLAFTYIFFAGVRWNDSLGPMLRAIHFLEANPHAAVYQKIFFEDRIKFQYPLTSLVPYYTMQKLGVGDAKLFRLSRKGVDLSFGLTILLSIVFALRLLAKQTGRAASRGETIALGLGLGIAGLVFNPLISGAVLGQIQAILTLGFTLALMCWLAGREAWAGAILGLMMLVKPQYGMFLLWALLRRKFNAAAAALICGATGFAASCALFGLRNNLDYLRVLQFIGRRGESYYPNQSVNGMLNRLTITPDIPFFNANLFAPENPLVFWGTMASTLALLLLALFYPWDKNGSGYRRQGGTADFACILLVSTMASPIAWSHHYAILFPIFVWLWFGEFAWRKNGWERIAIAAAYFLASNVFTPALGLMDVPGWNILTSNLYFGAVLVLVLLLRSGSGARTGRAAGPTELESASFTASPAAAG